eukprot:TRINITY_DN3176_c3_g17_i1.p1 TRINITY_DN3176_c3_g17~~TRINITY_DN3176_c3_g17_i1.p1  ORF type:complete len:284 (+),score=50.07 TRINITY_DN3176_c3_g17_i1:58-909(+)
MDIIVAFNIFRLIGYILSTVFSIRYFLKWSSISNPKIRYKTFLTSILVTSIILAFRVIIDIIQSVNKTNYENLTFGVRHFIFIIFMISFGISLYQILMTFTKTIRMFHQLAWISLYFKIFFPLLFSSGFIFIFGSLGVLIFFNVSTESETLSNVTIFLWYIYNIAIVVFFFNLFIAYLLCVIATWPTKNTPNTNNEVKNTMTWLRRLGECFCVALFIMAITSLYSVVDKAPKNRIDLIGFSVDDITLFLYEILTMFALFFPMIVVDIILNLWGDYTNFFRVKL